jgi:hypothetical protein
MNRVRRVGALAAGVVAVALVSGCGGGGDEAGPGVSASPSLSEVVSPTPEEETSPAADFPPTPEGQIDQLAVLRLWQVDDTYGSASAFVQDICDSLPVSAVESASRPQWLAESGHLDEDGAEVLEFGVPKLCPKWTAVVRAAVSGRYERWFPDGTYVVAADRPKASPSPTEAPDPDDFVTGGVNALPDKEEEGVEETIPPGTYRAQGRMENCYWERTAKNGDIIDNQFATSARDITVTIRASDGQFTSEGCAVWKPVK